MAYFIEPNDELAPQVVQAIQKIQNDRGPETMISPRGKTILNKDGEADYAVVCCVATLEADDMGIYEWGYVPVWVWLEEYFCDH